MPTVFSSRVGAFMAVPARLSVPFEISFEDNRQSFIVTHAAVNLQGNYQFLHTLDDFIYAYVFGDRMGSFQVSGIAFLGACNPSLPVGTAEVLNYYRINRIAKRKLPIACKLGPDVFSGFLTGCSVEASKAELNLGQYVLRFDLFPPRDFAQVAQVDTDPESFSLEFVSRPETTDNFASAN